MSRESADIVYRKLRAPAENGGALIDPPLANFAALIDHTRERLSNSKATLGRRSLPEFRKQAKGELRTILGEPIDLRQPIVVSGHQPELFHPGVWFKNWLLYKAANIAGATPINFVIDNDLASATAIRVPIREGKDVTTKSLAYDQPVAETPWEERPIRDREMFASFGDRAAKAISPIVADPLISTLWPYAIEEAKHTDRLGQVLSKARQRVEKSMGVSNLELSLSAICKTASFARFVVAILYDLRRFQQIYNTALHEYRRVHKLRSETHPAPDLDNISANLESPFWLWSMENPKRQPMFVRETSAGLLLTNKAGVKVGPIRANHFEKAVEQLQNAQRSGIKIRPRALATTLFLRLAVADLFIHGIGGAKYDQATDVIAERFFGVTPAPYMTATATLHLPIRCDVSDLTLQIREKNRALRDLIFNPQRFIEDGNANKLIDERDSWIQQAPTRGDGKQRRAEIIRLNRELQPFVAEVRQQTEAELRELQRRQRTNIAATSREFSFVLFSKDQVAAAFQSSLNQP